MMFSTSTKNCGYSLEASPGDASNLQHVFCQAIRKLAILLHFPSRDVCNAFQGSHRPGKVLEFGLGS